MTKTLKWRLGKLPTSEEVLELMKNELITKKEAKEILFSEENTEEISISSLKDEIKFLRELVEKLSNKTQIIETIRTIEKPYIHWGWYQPYVTYCNSGLISATNDATSYVMTTAGTSGTTYLSVTNAKFSEIQTF